MFDRVWFWRARLAERKGQACRILARGKMNSILVEFEDGYRVITSAWAVRKIMDKKGLYGKYEIKKRDGSPVDPKAVYFTLRLDTDPHARAAIRAYIESCRKDQPELAKDLEAVLAQFDEEIPKKAIHKDNGK